MDYLVTIASKQLVQLVLHFASAHYSSCWDLKHSPRLTLYNSKLPTQQKHGTTTSRSSSRAWQDPEPRELQEPFHKYDLQETF